jgi:hypothetical protein
MPKQKPEEQLLNLLKSVLPKAVPDAKLAEKIFDAFQRKSARRIVSPRSTNFANAPSCLTSKRNRLNR